MSRAHHLGQFKVIVLEMEANEMRPVMLALSTFRKSDKAVELALTEARASRTLVVVFVVDINVARYIIGTDIGLWPELKESCEEEVLQKHEKEAEEGVQVIARKAEGLGLTVRTYVTRGRFALECLEVAKNERPGLIVTTRSNRPDWVRRFFGSPVDRIIAESGCRVVTA